MVYQKGLTVALRNGIDGSLLEEYNCETTNTRVSVGAIEDIVLCPEITIHGALFDWDKADGLYISVHYGSVSPDITLWVPHPFKGIAMSGRVDWTFQIPGLDVWDRSQSKVVRYLYRFTHAQVCTDTFLRFSVHANWLSPGRVARMTVRISKRAY